jgi:hypothetical protein
MTRIASFKHMCITHAEALAQQFDVRYADGQDTEGSNGGFQ